MNEQTPETNHVEAQLTNMSHPFVWQLCRKLECERDEARELADRLAKIVDEGLEGTDEGLEGMNEDGHLFITEARKALAAWKEARND